MLIRLSLLSAAVGAALFIPATADAGRIIWPVSASVTSPYGPRSSPCSGCSTFHHGIDLGCASGTTAGSPGNGTLTSYAYDSCGGNILKIGYGNGWETRFLHMSGRIAAVGAAISRNANAGYTGNTGSCTTGAHLHFEVRKDGASQLIPGARGEWKTRNTEIPQEYPGLNDPVSTVVTIDNSSAGFSVVGSWAVASSAADKYGADYRYKSTAPVSEPASWATSLSAGTYSIQAWWPAGTNRSAAAPYILPDGASVHANQQINGGKWNVLASRSLSGAVTTKLSCWATSGYVVMADAIRYVR